MDKETLVASATSVAKETRGVFKSAQAVEGSLDWKGRTESAHTSGKGRGGIDSFGSHEECIDGERDQAKRGRGMLQDTEQREELSSDIQVFCALIARIMYRCLKERDPRLLALLKEPAGDPLAGEDRVVRNEENPDQSA